METKKYNYVYQITNVKTNKIYIGVHSTNNIDDGYMGSSDAVRLGIKKYPIGTYTKTILSFYDTAGEAYNEEKYIVDQKFISSNKTYNCTLGGYGGWPISARIESKLALSRPEVREKLSMVKTGKLNPMSKYTWITPAGTFESLTKAHKALGISKSTLIRRTNGYKNTPPTKGYYKQLNK